ncbi:uncharacterized protein LOC125531784 [Triticum urartu]|uniref:uncharacterized protein LOC125513049 n=1 Tax=Triticum urartu TaxID=4572 RepID=UPI0020449023|nr:uncharacterized protein LOC125513049 [Triticum urartu]XP_048552008.1 uncharacterized protein LOC125531784 [Triticum urartu]
MFQEDYGKEKGKAVRGKADLILRLTPAHFNLGQTARGEFLVGQSSSAPNPIIRDQHLLSTGSTAPTSTATTANKIVQNNIAEKGQFTSTGSIEIYKSSPDNRPGLQDFDMEELHYSVGEEATLIQHTQNGQRQGLQMSHLHMQNNPTIQAPSHLGQEGRLQMPVQNRDPSLASKEKHVHINQPYKLSGLITNSPSRPTPTSPNIPSKRTYPAGHLPQLQLLKRTTTDCARNILSQLIETGQGNTKRGDELQDVMHAEATSGDGGQEKGAAVHTDRGQETEDNHASHGGPERGEEVETRRGGNLRQQHVGRPSGWDIPPRGFEVLDANLQGGVFGFGSSADRCYGSSRKMGVGSSMRRNKRYTMEQLGRPYPPPCKRVEPAMKPTESDPSANRLPCVSSPDSSEASVNSRVEAISPSHTVDYHQTGLNVNLGDYRSDTPTSLKGDSGPILMVHGDTVIESESLRGENMELDRAVVPTHKAPRAP